MFKGRYLGMVSQWMENGNLHEYIRKNPRVDRYRLCIQVASGLAYMHDVKMVHGDLKAINVLVSSEGVAKLSDFDFSLMLEASLAFSESSNHGLGALEFFSESPSGRTKSSDVYALGMTMLEIFTGAVPYPQLQRDFQVIVKVQQGVLPIRPKDRFKDDGRGNQMWELLASCWNRDPDARPSVAEVVESLNFISSRNT
ncbi:kinase-like domain-containing protein [Rhizoctonia solani]|nr:kinase-like domain-containing protein [Rhizoctonia solani]